MEKKNKEALMWVSILTAISVLTSIGIIGVIAQTPSSEKFFTKDFCINEITLLDGINYPNGEELSYDSSGCPVSTKIVHRWNELTTVQKTLITTRMSTNGYIEGEEITSLSR